MVRVIALFSAAAVMLGIAAGFFYTFRTADADPFATCRRSAVAGGSAAIGGPFTLVDPSGDTVTETEAITGPTMIYFGYTFCPDFCPMDVARNAEVVGRLKERGIDVRQVFVSVDPARDTPDVLGDFASFFEPAPLALTGSDEAVASAANAYRVYFQRRDGDDEFYMVDHSTFTYLMAPEVGFLDFFPSATGAAEMTDAVACYAERL